MRRGIAALLCVSVLLTGGVSLCAAEEQPGENSRVAEMQETGSEQDTPVTGEEKEQAAPSDEEKLLNLLGDLIENNEELRSILENEIAGVSDEDREEVAENLELAARIMRSQEFQDFIAHSEVREFLDMLALKTADFIKENPDTTKEILITLGMSEPAAGILMDLMQITDLTSVLLQNSFDHVEGKGTEDFLLILAGAIKEDAFRKDVLKMLEDTGGEGPQNTGTSDVSPVESAAASAG